MYECKQAVAALLSPHACTCSEMGMGMAMAVGKEKATNTSDSSLPLTVLYVHCTVSSWIRGTYGWMLVAGWQLLFGFQPLPTSVVTLVNSFPLSLTSPHAFTSRILSGIHQL